MGTVALIIQYEKDKETPSLVEVLTDDREIEIYESAHESSMADPMEAVQLFRREQIREDEEFGDYIEELLSQPFVKPEIKEHGIKWLKSKIKIEHFQKRELEAAKIIADYAFKVFMNNPDKLDFLLSGPSTAVRIRIFTARSVKNEAA